MTTVEGYAAAGKGLPEPSVRFLTEFDALWDSVVVDLRLSATIGRAEMLISGFGTPPEYNTAVIALHGLHEFQYAVSTPGRIWFTIHLWKPQLVNGTWSIEVTSEQGASLTASASGAEIVVGHASIADKPPPDFALATDEEIVAGMVSWESEFTPMARQEVGLVPYRDLRALDT